MKPFTFTLPYFKLILLSILLTGIIACQNQEAKNLVKNIDEFNAAVKNLKPGDKITMANGVWKDAELVFKGKGTAEQPIILTVEKKGAVTLEGQSNIRIAGEYLHVEGLVFKNGYTPTGEVISLRRNKEDLCNHCRVTECVVDNYNNPERFESDYWVGIYGKNNRFDHNYLTGKRNQGVTLAVRMNTEASRENNNRVDHNYFGHRPILGSNGGETLRVGTSHYSLSNSNTIVESNYFDRCNGEHEIISNKACQSIYRNNTFYECQGTLTMRHGNETLVENNYFFGNGKANTGGIRIINETQKVINNYCEGLTGFRFRGALVIMNGVPNSPLNRYFPVIDSEASNNTFVNCDHIQLCAGSDEERSAAPKNTVVNKNLFYHDNKENLFTIYDDISGISFNNNVMSDKMKPFQSNGFSTQKISLTKSDDGLMIPDSDIKDIGFKPGGERATPENTGVSWYPKKEETIQFNTGKVIPVSPGENTLLDAIAQSASGDIIELQQTGDYEMTKSIDLSHPVTVVASSKLLEKPVLKFQKTSLFNINNGGALTLKGVNISGKECRDRPLNTVIRTSKYSMIRNYKLIIEDCNFNDLDINHSFNVLKVFKNTFADSIVLRNCNFADVSGHVLALDKEIDDIGIYNAENVVIENCTFKNIGGTALNLHRGGRDESTFGPILEVSNCQFENVGKDKRNKADATITTYGVQVALYSNNTFKDCKPVKQHLVVGEPIVKYKDCQFINSGKIISNDDAYETVNVSFK